LHAAFMSSVALNVQAL